LTIQGILVKGKSHLFWDKFFFCTMKMDATIKGGFRNTLNEICLYKVEDGKILREEFFYTHARVKTIIINTYYHWCILCDMLG